MELMFSVVLFLVVFALLCWYFYPQRPSETISELKKDMCATSVRLANLERNVAALDMEIEGLMDKQIAEEVAKAAKAKGSRFMVDFWG